MFISGRELAQIAIGIEKNGAAYYQALAESTTDSKAADIYRLLSDKEREHMVLFQDMLQQTSDYQPTENYTEEYDLYMKALVNSAVFSNEETARQTAQKAAGKVEAIQIGITAEKDSILFYTEMRDLVRRTDREIINKIIDEERMHLRRLSELKDSFGK